MAEMETLGILEEIETLVSHRLQVVSYKWLSRNFLVSSDSAKKLLEEFVEKHNGGLEVMYTVAGWLKRSPPTYNARLVPSSKLADAKRDFGDNYSVQVYSVQASIPKDPAALWNAEFVQTEELFKQMITVDNCLRDNRFSGVSNSLVKHNGDGIQAGLAVPQPKGAVASVLSRGNSANTDSLTHQQKNSLQARPKEGLQSSSVTSVKVETDSTGARDLEHKPASNKEKASLPANRKKGQNGTSSAGSGCSLANFFGRASTKLKSTNEAAETTDVAPKTTVSAEAQITAHEAEEGGSSDDEGQNLNFKRASNGESGKKRRVILDDSDDEFDYPNTVNLASPDPPKAQSSLEKRRTLDLEQNSLNFDEEDKSPLPKEEKLSDRDSKLIPKKDASAPKKATNSGIAANAASEVQLNICANDLEKESKVADVSSVSPKRRKVLKTRIDERGREVTEVVWEGEDAQTKNTNNNAVKNADDHAKKNEENAAKNPINRADAVKKSPAQASTAQPPVGKTAGKKGGNAKDPKQGNIMSFFKRA